MKDAIKEIEYPHKILYDAKNLGKNEVAAKACDNAAILISSPARKIPER